MLFRSPVEYPPQQKKAGAVLAHAYALANAKARQEQAARRLLELLPNNDAHA